MVEPAGSVEVLELVPGDVIVQPLGAGNTLHTVARTVISVDRVVRRSGRWVLIEAREGDTRLGLEYPASCRVLVAGATYRPQPLPPDEPEPEEVGVVLLRVAIRQPAHLARNPTMNPDGRRAAGVTFCGKSIYGRVLIRTSEGLLRVPEADPVWLCRACSAVLDEGRSA